MELNHIDEEDAFHRIQGLGRRRAHRSEDYAREGCPRDGADEVDVELVQGPEKRAGPRLLKGLNDPPEIGAKRNISTIKLAPTMSPCFPVPRTYATTHNTTRQSTIVPTASSAIPSIGDTPGPSLFEQILFPLRQIRRAHRQLRTPAQNNFITQFTVTPR